MIPKGDYLITSLHEEQELYSRSLVGRIAIQAFCWGVLTGYTIWEFAWR